MALDHVRDFFHRGAMFSSPTDLAVTTPFLFFTGSLTHICAPVFMSRPAWACISTGQRVVDPDATLVVCQRGLWLIVLELTVMQLV